MEAVRNRALALAVLLAAVTLAACKDTTTAGPTATGSPSAAAVVPGVVGKRLSAADDELSAAGFSHVATADATGQGRVVLIPENWIVQSQDPAAGSRVNRKTRITLNVRKPSDGAGGAATTSGVVPDVLCKDLQSAQDTLQAAGFDRLGSIDGTGQGRAQIIDQNWVVTGQSAAPGSRPGTDTRIVLTAVKFGEPTGSSGCPS